MIEVKLSFATQAELVAFFTGTTAPAVAVHVTDIPAEVQEAAAPAKKPRAKKIESGAAGATESKSASGPASDEPAAVEPVQKSTATEHLLSSPANAKHLATSLAQAAAGEAKERELVEPSYTVDDVRKALQAYSGAHGFPAATELVKSFGATRITELKAEDYAAFIAKTEEKAAA